MKTKYFLLSMLVAAAFVSCTDEYDDTQIKADLADVTERVESLETNVASLTSDISTIEKLVAALENNTYITSVEEVTNGYQINFSVGDPITIYNGTDGEDGEDGTNGTNGAAGAAGAAGADGSVVSIKQDTDENYYWTIDGAWLLDGEGNKMPVTVAATEIGVAKYVYDVNGENDVEAYDGNIYWTVNGEWLTYGEEGDLVLAVTPVISITDNETYITFSIDGTEYDVPLYVETSIALSAYSPSIDMTTDSNEDKSTTVTVELTGFTAENYNGIKAVVTDADGNDGIDLLTKGVADGSNWGVEIGEPDFGTNTIGITVTPCTGLSASTTAELVVTLYDTAGNSYTKTAMISYKHLYSYDVSNITNIDDNINTALASESSATVEITNTGRITSSNQTLTLDASDADASVSIIFSTHICERQSSGSGTWRTLTFTDSDDFYGSLYITTPEDFTTEQGNTSNASNYYRSNITFDLPNANIYFNGTATTITVTVESGKFIFESGTIKTLIVNGTTYTDVTVEEGNSPVTYPITAE